MDYREFIQDIKALEFIEDEDTADAAIKAVLGILSSSLEEEDARRITGVLPAPLDIVKLRGHQVRPTNVSYDECLTEVAQQFNMDNEHARLLTDAVLRSTRAALGGEKLAEVEDILPESWRSAIEYA